MRRLLLVALALILISSSYAYAIPVIVEFNGSIDNSRFPINNAPGAPEITSQNSIINGLFAYESDAVATKTSSFESSFTGNNLFISVNNKYNYKSSSTTIFLDTGIFDQIFVSANLSALDNYSLPPMLDFRLALDKHTKFNNTLELPTIWSTDMFYPTYTDEAPGVFLSNKDYDTFLAFNIDNISSHTPALVPEPSTVLLFGAGMVGAALLRRKLQKG